MKEDTQRVAVGQLVQYYLAAEHGDDQGYQDWLNSDRMEPRAAVVVRAPLIPGSMAYLTGSVLDLLVFHRDGSTELRERVPWWGGSVRPDAWAWVE